MINVNCPISMEYTKYLKLRSAIEQERNEDGNVEIDENIDYAIPEHLNEPTPEKDNSDESGTDDNDLQLNGDVAEGSVNCYGQEKNYRMG